MVTSNDDAINTRIHRSTNRNRFASNLPKLPLPVCEIILSSKMGGEIDETPTHCVDVVDELSPEESLPNFQSRVYALSQLSVSAPTIALSRSRGEGRRRMVGRRRIVRANPTSYSTSSKSDIPSPNSSQHANSAQSLATSRKRRGKDLDHEPPPLPIRRESRSFPARRCPVSNCDKDGVDSSPRIPLQSVQPEDDSDDDDEEVTLHDDELSEDELSESDDEDSSRGTDE